MHVVGGEMAEKASEIWKNERGRDVGIPGQICIFLCIVECTYMNLDLKFGSDSPAIRYSGIYIAPVPKFPTVLVNIRQCH